MYQLKAHLEKTARQAFRMLPERERSTYESAVTALKKRFRPVDIEDLRGIEFHQIMQEGQSVEQLGIELQSLGRKAFPSASSQEFDRLLKGRFFQVLLPKWQQKLGAPKTTETFSDLYDRARTLERHEKQFSAAAVARGEGKAKGGERTSRPPYQQSNRFFGRQDSLKRLDAKNPPRKEGYKAPVPETGSSRSSESGTSKRGLSGRACYRCGSFDHFARHCSQRGGNFEAPGRASTHNVSRSASTLAVDAIRVSESLTVQQLEQLLTQRRLSEEQHLLETRSGRVHTVTALAKTSDAVGPTVHLDVLVEGVSVEAIVDSGSQLTIISRTFLHRIGQQLRHQGKPLPKLEQPTAKLYGKGGEELTVSAQTTLALSADGKTVNVPVFVQPNSTHLCLIGMNALPDLGVTMLRANGKHLKQSMGTASVSNVRLIQAAVIPGRKAKFVEAKLDAPFREGEELMFEPDVNTLRLHGLQAPEALVTLRPDARIWVPIENPEALSTQLRQDLPLGRVVHLPDQFGLLSRPCLEGTPPGHCMSVESEVSSSSTVPHQVPLFPPIAKNI